MLNVILLAVFADPTLRRSGSLDSISSSGSLDSFKSFDWEVASVPNPNYKWFNPFSWNWFSPEKPVEELSSSLSRSSSLPNLRVPEPIANQGIVGKWNQLPVRSSGSLSDMESGLLRSSSLDSFEGVGRVSMSRSPSVENLASSLSHSQSLGNVEKGLAVGTGGVVAAKTLAQGPSFWSRNSPSAWWNWATTKTKDASTVVKDLKNGVDKGLNKEAIELWSRRAKYAVVGVAATAAAVGAYNIYKGMKKSKMEKTLEPLADKLGA